MAHGLEKRERGKQHKRHDGNKHQLIAGVDRARSGGGEAGQNQGKCDDYRHRAQSRGHAFQAEVLHQVFARTQQQTRAYDAVQNNHHRCKNGVSRQTHGGFAARHHHRHNQRHFNNGHSHGQYQSAKRFANAVGDDFGVVNGCNHAADQTQG